MDDIVYKINVELQEEDVKQLYSDAGWLSYTKNLPQLMDAIRNSLMLVTAWSEKKLVGLVRVVGDKHVILYIQDILVLKDFKRKGIGTELLGIVFRQFSNVRQIVLLTEDLEETRVFYESLGFSSCDDGKTVAFAIQK